jgi:chromosome segregation ATPase
MALEVEVEVLKSVVNKLDQSIEKISQVSNDIGRLLAVHNERIDQLERMSDLRVDEIKELHSRITTQTREIVDKMDAMQSRLEHKMHAQGEASQAQHKEIQNEIKTDIARVESRVSALENWKWWIIGAAAAVGFILGNLSDIAKVLQ